jgi:hypothetical protein
MKFLQRSGLSTGFYFPPPFWRGLRCGFPAPAVSVARSAEQQREKALSPSWTCCAFGRIDEKNATIVFSDGPFGAILRKSSQ